MKESQVCDTLSLQKNFMSGAVIPLRWPKAQAALCKTCLKP